MNHHSAHTSNIVHISSLPDGQAAAVVQEYSTWTANLQNVSGLDDVGKVVPIMVSIPNMFDNITSYNNVLNITIAGTAGIITITVPPGFYDTATLLSTLQTLIRVHQADVVVQQNTSTGLVSVISPTNKLTILFSSTLASVLGFVNFDYPTGEGVFNGVTQPANGVEAPITPNVNTAPLVLLHCNHSENNSIHSFGKRSHLLCVLEFGNTQRGATKTFTAEDLHQWEVVYNSHRSLSAWTFQLTDAQLNPVFLPSNCSVEVFMKLISTQQS